MAVWGNRETSSMHVMGYWPGQPSFEIYFYNKQLQINIEKNRLCQPHTEPRESQGSICHKKKKKPSPGQNGPVQKQQAKTGVE